jgi:broad specificity phosphatase PhoE
VTSELDDATRRLVFLRVLVVGNLDTVTSSPRSEFSITLVRHGESDWNESQLVQGQNNDARLTARGQKQAQLVAESLRSLGFDYLFTSDLDRAEETASIIGATLGLTPEIDTLLRERSFGSFEGGPLKNLTSVVTGISDHVLVDPDARPPAGESFRDVVVRAELFIDRLKNEWPSNHLLVVTHGGTVRALRANWSRTALEGLTWDRVGNCSVWTLDANGAQ